MYQSLSLSLLAATYVRAFCPPTGHVLPPPTIPHVFEIPNLLKSLDHISNGKASWNSTTTSFSVSITSRNATFFEYHQTAPLRNDSGVKRVDKNTVYRVASSTKIFTTLALLLERPENLDDSITKYVPELANVVDYKDITLRMLASQLAAVPRDGYAFDLYSQGPLLETLGFPTPGPSDIPNCDGNPGETQSVSCSRAQLFTTLLNNDLVWLPADRAAYSDQAYILLGFALENITGKSYGDVLREKITQPLNLSNTSLDPPPSSSAIIPAGPLSSWFRLDIGNFKATAGLYSTPADMSTFLRSILNNHLLSPIATRHWLKPSAFTSSLYSDVGMPWEIFRPTDLTPSPRPIELYTKSGDFPGYAAWSILLPEYEVAVIINAAGDGAYDATAQLLHLIPTHLVPLLDKMAREQATNVYSGKYISTNTSSYSSLELSVDQGPGLKISNWTNDGKPMFTALATIYGTDNPDYIDARLYPTGDSNRWRMGVEVQGSIDGVEMIAKGCQNWKKVDQVRYAKLPLDEFHFAVQDGKVMGVANLGLRSSLAKTS